MKNFSLSVKIIVIYLFLFSGGLTKESKYFNEGVELFQNKKFDKSKIFFEKDIVFNPRSEKSYLFLAKIFNEIDFVYSVIIISHHQFTFELE